MTNTRHVAVSFNAKAFYADIDRTRVERGLSWYDVARQVGLSHAWVYRMHAGAAKPSVDTVCLLLDWHGSTDMAPYLSYRGADQL